MTKVTPFTFVDSISWTKDDIFDEETAVSYVPFIINRHMSLFKDTVLYANDMNMAAHAPKYSQYSFFLSSIPKRKRFAKWIKRIENEDIAAISMVYQCNHQRAEEISELLTPPQLTAVKALFAEINNVREPTK